MNQNFTINLIFVVANILLLLLLWTSAAYPQQQEFESIGPVWEEQVIDSGTKEYVPIVPVWEEQVLWLDGRPPLPVQHFLPQPDHQHVLRQLPGREKVLALTFDDGPHSSLPKLLAILEQKEVAATFFLLGARALQKPELVREIAAAGCDIAIHTWDHPRLTEMSPQQIYWQVEATAVAFNALGVQPQPMVRPPYGRWDEEVQQICADLGYHLVMWDVDSRDWEDDDCQSVLKRVLAKLRPGSVVLFHEGKEVTRQLLPQFIDEARARGYRFVLLSEYLPPGRNFPIHGE